MTDTDELLAKINKAKKEAMSYTETLSDARNRQVLIDDQLAKLSQKLQELTGAIDWDELGNLIEKAANSAQEAVQALQSALDEAGVDSE